MRRTADHAARCRGVRSQWPRLFAAAGALAGVASDAVRADEVFSGDAYRLGSNELLYHETHYSHAGTQGRETLVVYSCADGRPFARKHTQAGGDAQTPDFDLLDARLGYREGVRERNGRREVYVQRTRQAPEQSSPLQVPPEGVIDMGFDVFAQRHWRALQHGDTVPFEFLVPSRRTFFSFEAGAVANPQAPAGSVTFRLAPASLFAFLLPHIDVSYDTATREPLRYEGLANVRDTNGKNYRVRLDYPQTLIRREVAPAEIDALLAQPLATTCPAADSAASARGHAAVPKVTPPASPRNLDR